MKFISSLLLMAVLSFAACLYFPWWSVAVVCFIVALILPQRAGIAFICGFLALFLLWGGLSYWISYNNEDLLAHKLSVVIIKQDNPTLLILMTGLIGALVGGIASLTGSLARPRSKE